MPHFKYIWHDSFQMYMTWLISNICMTWINSYVYDMPHSKHIWHASFQMCMTWLIPKIYDMTHFKCIWQDSLPSAFLSMIMSRTVLPNMFFFCKKKKCMTWLVTNARYDSVWHDLLQMWDVTHHNYMSCLPTRRWWWNIWHDSSQMYDMTHTNVWQE